MTTDQKNSILYQSQVWVANTGYSIMQKEQYSQSCDREYDLAFRILNYQLVLLDAQVDDNLTVKEQEYIYRCIQDSLNLQNYPVAPLPFAMVESVDIIIGQQGPAGIPGANGANGTDADIDVITDDSELQVVESVILGVKTFTIRNFKYVVPALTVALEEASIPDPDQSHVVETGEVIASLALYVNLTKGRDAVTASTLTTPGSLTAAYAAEVDLVDLNTNGTQAITLNLSNVAASQTYTVNITDGINTPAASVSITFVKPFLYGSSATVLTTTHYTDLQKLIQTQGNKAVAFNASEQYFWFGFPESYGTLTQILDQNGFDVTSAFSVFTPVSVTPTGLDVNTPSDYTFYRTTLQTTINGTYTFKF